MYSKCVFKALEKLAFPYSTPYIGMANTQVNNKTNYNLRLTKALSAGHYNSVHTLTPKKIIFNTHNPMQKTATN